MAQMGYVAACVDDELLENGPTFLASVERDTGFRLLSANLQDAAGQPVLPAFTETTVGNVRVAVIGLTGFPSGPPEGGVPGGMRFEDPEVSLSRVLALLANDPPEVILLLAHLDLGETRDLMLRHPEIAAAVLGHSYTLPGTQNDAEGRPIYYVTFEGKRVGVVNVTLTAKGPVFSGYDRASVERSLVPDGEIQAIIDGR
jgi:2',3'-cyclic-nucleotide 2'-phosphodiesterase (5'-nucleotidase family)